MIKNAKFFIRLKLWSMRISNNLKSTQKSSKMLTVLYTAQSIFPRTQKDMKMFFQFFQLSIFMTSPVGMYREWIS